MTGLLGESRIDCMPDEPVPITPTRLPVRSTPSEGQSPVWKHSPAKVGSPSIAGRLATDSWPVAITT